MKTWILGLCVLLCVLALAPPTYAQTTFGVAVHDDDSSVCAGVLIDVLVEAGWEHVADEAFERAYAMCTVGAGTTRELQMSCPEEAGTSLGDVVISLPPPHTPQVISSNALAILAYRPSENAVVFRRVEHYDMGPSSATLVPYCRVLAIELLMELAGAIPELTPLRVETYDRRTVRTVIFRLQSELVACRAEDSEEPIRIDVTFVTRSDGVVVSASADNEDSLGPCVESVLGDITFSSEAPFAFDYIEFTHQVTIP